MAMRIFQIKLKNFQAFKGECVIDLRKGRNLLLYGENGSGKSSLYQALNCFLSTGTPFSSHQNLFAMAEEGYIKLAIGDGDSPSKTYEWEATTHPFAETLIAEASKTKGFLDYRSLLETHFVHRKSTVNVFDLLVNNLLSNIETPIGPSNIKNDLETIKYISAKHRTERNKKSISYLIENFNSNLITILANLEVKSNEILQLFEQNIVISMALIPPGVGYDPETKTILNQTVLLTATYYGKGIPDHHHFLNEARLSAIAISIYFAALKLNPSSELKVLFLDDVLIGLDMSNRLPLLDILNRYFFDWQIIIATYDRVWFDMVWQRVQEGGKWQEGALYCTSTCECDMPVYAPDKDYLKVAKRHLSNNDEKAAAVYLRSAFEHIIKGFCEKHRLRVRYCEDPKKHSSQDFWGVVKAQKLKNGAGVLDSKLKKDVEVFRATILNQLCHAAPFNPIKKEVEKAAKTINDLQIALINIKVDELKKTK